MPELSIQQAVDFVLWMKNLNTRQKYENWRGHEGNKKLFVLVKMFAKSHWERLAVPESSVIAHYERRLSGYKRFERYATQDKFNNIVSILTSN